MTLFQWVIYFCRVQRKSIFEQASCTAYPNLFVKFREEEAVNQELPNWVKQIVTESSNKATYRVQSNRVYLSLATGFEASASLDVILKIPESQIQAITNFQDLVVLFMSLTSSELDTDASLDFSPLGGA